MANLHVQLQFRLVPKESAGRSREYCAVNSRMVHIRSEDHMTTAIPPEPKPDTGPVLFDEDYRAHIARLDARLERERAEVIRLRELVEDLRRREK